MRSGGCDESINNTSQEGQKDHREKLFSRWFPLEHVCLLQSTHLKSLFLTDRQKVARGPAAVPEYCEHTPCPTTLVKIKPPCRAPPGPSSGASGPEAGRFEDAPQSGKPT